MCSVLIWMSSEEAKLFYVEAESISVEKLKYHGHKHHAEKLGKNHPKNQTDEQTFYKQLAEKLNDIKFKRVLLMGPSQGPIHFSTYLEKSHPEIFSKVIGVEKVDHMPDSEILSAGRKYLQKYYLYNAV